MPSEISNPFSTGGGGFSFETSVQAGFLALMFVGGKCPCLHQGKIHTLRFQAKQAGYQIDDLLIIAADQDGTDHRLLIQSKHEIKFTKSNEAYVETIRAAWTDFTNGEKFDRKNDSIAIVSGPHSAKVINHARPVLEWARFSESSEEFFSKVASEKFSSNSKKEFVADLRFILQDVLTPLESDDALWNFLQTLHLLSYDFDVTRGQDEARSLTLIDVSKGDHSDVPAEAIWADFLKVAREANVTAATLTRESVQKLLSEASKKAFPLTIGAGGESLGKLVAHSQHVLNRITNEFVKDVSLNRRQIITEAIDLAEQTQVLIITGDAGAGKSAIAKELVQRLERQEGIPVFGQLMDAESKAKPGKNREIDYGFRSEYANLYAQFIFHSGVPLHAGSSPLREIIKSIMAAPKLSAMLLTKIFHCQDRHRNDERFWLVWRACALPLFNSPKILEWKHDAQELLRVLIFAQGYWKAGEKWPPLEDNLTFIRDALHYVGEVPAGFSMLVSTFRTVASSLLPDAIIELELQFKKIDKEHLVTDENLKISLEWLLRDCIFSSSTLIRKRDVLRTAVITLLDFLVDEGRSLAFQMREMVISPIRNR